MAVSTDDRTRQLQQGWTTGGHAPAAATLRTVQGPGIVEDTVIVQSDGEVITRAG